MTRKLAGSEPEVSKTAWIRPHELHKRPRQVRWPDVRRENRIEKGRLLPFRPTEYFIHAKPQDEKGDPVLNRKPSRLIPEGGLARTYSQGLTSLGESCIATSAVTNDGIMAIKFDQRLGSAARRTVSKISSRLLQAC
jgi:hypothetical protein